MFFFHQKEDFIRENVFKKDFFHGFANFSISENIQKFTLFRKVLLPLNEKYSGLRADMLCKRDAETYNKFTFLLCDLIILQRFLMSYLGFKSVNSDGNR